ncbi:MAG: sialidase [Gemmatimonadetes bacterium]|nr:sialidase [Gemmatimonadota bacterium]
MRVLRHSVSCHRALGCAMAVLVGLAFAAPLQAQFRRNMGPRARPAEPLHFQYMGPESAGRIASVAGIPGDTLTYYLGAASGGVWKTTDGARTFEPVFDEEPVQAIGALAVSPANHDVVWAGTGEAWAIRDADVMGDGVYKSTDGGKTWTHMGLDQTGRIGRIIAHPTDPNTAYVCALGRTTGPQQERGVYRTTDGGATWKRVLFVDEHTGCSGLAMDPNDPNVLFAGMWQVVMHTWVMYTGGPGSGVYMSRDGGSTWKHLTNGLPKAPVGKIDVAVAPSDSKRVYALIQTAGQGSLWRSDDGGASWKTVSWNRDLIGRGGYYIRVAVNPKNEDEVLVANSSFHRSTDGGHTFPIIDRGCGDCHDIWMDPLNPDHWVITGDGGAGITTDHAHRFTRVTLPIGQMYHVAVDAQVPYWIYSNRQDDGTMRGPSDRPVPVPNVPSYAPQGRGRFGGRGGFGGFGGGRGGSAWQSGLGGCESGFTLPDKTDPNIVWASCYGNTVTRWDATVGIARSVSPWIHTLDSPPEDTKYRCHWTPPLAIDPFDQETVYYGCQVIFKTSDKGQSWSVISPDLSTQDSSRIAFSGGIPGDTRHILGDNLGQYYGEVVFAIAPSDIRRGLIWAGTNDGKLWYTPDGGGSWVDVTKNVGMPAWGTIRKIQPSHFDPATAYVAVDYHMMDNRDPFIYKTTDYGKTWTNITGDLPKGGPLDYVMAVTENPNRKGMLFAGTGDGFYYSMDDGGHWTQLQRGLPAAPVTWIVVEPRYHDVVVSTYGRGLYVLRDITRLEQADSFTDAARPFLYDPHDGFRQARNGNADFLYWLPAGDTADVHMQILDGSGKVVRTLPLVGIRGLNEATWNLQFDGPAQPELRTVAPYDPHIWEEARFKGKDTRPVIHWGIGGTQTAGPLASPGTYTARLMVGGSSFEHTFPVIKDPAIRTSEADLEASTAAQVRIRDDIDRAVSLINRLEIMRKQVQDLTAEHKGDSSLERPLAALGSQMMDVELRLLSRTTMNSDDKWYVESYKVYLNLVWLYGQVGLGAGDVAGGADHRPTDASMQVLAMIEGHLQEAETAFGTLVRTDVPAFNKRMAGKLPAIAVPR